MRKVLPKIFLTALFLVLTSTAPGAQSAGSPAPEIALKDISGKYVSFIGLRGSVILLNFWATWCPPCRAEVPLLNKLFNDYGPKGFVVVGVSSDDASDIKEFAASHSVLYPMLADPRQQAHRLYHVQFVPTTFIIDRSGIIRKKIPGEIPAEEVRKTIEELLK